MDSVAIKIYDLVNRIRLLDDDDLRKNDLINNLCSYFEEDLRERFMLRQDELYGTQEYEEDDFQRYLGEQVLLTFNI